MEKLVVLLPIGEKQVDLSYLKQKQLFLQRGELEEHGLLLQIHGSILEMV